MEYYKESTEQSSQQYPSQNSESEKKKKAFLAET